MKKIILSILVLTLIFLSKQNAASNWTNYNNFNQVTDAQPKGSDVFITAKGGVLLVNKLSGNKRFFDKYNSSLPSTSVEQVSKSNFTGDIWIGTYDNGLARWNGVDFVPTAYPADFGLLLGMKFGPDGLLYLQSDNGAYQFNTITKAYKKFNATSTNVWLYDAWSFDFTSAGDLVVFSGTNCLTVDLPTLNIIDSFETLTTPLVSGCSSATSNIYYFNNDKTLINIADFTLGFLHRDGTSTDANLGLPVFSSVKTIRGTDNNMYCLLDNKDVYKLVDSTWNFAYTLGTDHLATKYFYEDGSNAYLNSTDFNEMGVDAVFHARGIVHQVIDSRKYVFKSTVMNSVFKDNAGKIYAVSGTDIYQYDKVNDTWINYVTAPSIFGEIRHVKYINGKIYAENYGNLIEFYDGISWTQVPMAVGSVSPYVFAYDVTSSGIIYFCNDEGVYKYESGSTTKLLSTTVFAAWFYSIKYDASREVLWLGKSNEIISYDFSSTTNYNNSTVSSLPASMSIQEIAMNPTDNSVWFGSSDNLAFRYDGIDFTTYTTPNLMPSYIDQILFDSNGEIIFKNIDMYGGFYTYYNGNWRRFHPDVMSDMSSSSVARMVIDNEGNYWTANSDGQGVSMYKNTISSIENSMASTEETTLFPNPADQQIQCTLNIESTEIKVFDLRGQELSVPFTVQNQLVNVNTKELQNGLYFLKTKTQSLKFVVQH